MAKPSKNLVGRRVRVVTTGDTDLKPGSIGTVDSVTPDGLLCVTWDDGTAVNLSWDMGDRWTVLPQGS